MLVVLGERYDIPLGRNLQPTTATNFDVWTFKLSDQRTFPLENGNVETISVAISDQNITGIADVYAVWIICDVLAADTMEGTGRPRWRPQHNVPAWQTTTTLECRYRYCHCYYLKPVIKPFHWITVLSGSIWFPDQKLI